MKSSDRKSQREEKNRRIEERRSEKRKSQKKEGDADTEKGMKIVKHRVFRMFCGSRGSKSRLATAVGAEPAGQMRDEKLHATQLWREAHFEVKMDKAHQRRTTFGLWRQNVQTTRGSDHFWRFRCRFASRHYTTGHYTTLHSSTLHYTTLHSSTFHYTKLHYTTLHYTE